MPHNNKDTEGSLTTTNIEAGEILDTDLEENTVRKEDFSAGDSVYAKLQRFVGKFGVEERGIERVPRDERLGAGMYQIGMLVRNHTEKYLFCVQLL